MISRHLGRHFVRRAVGFDEQHRRGVERIVRVHELLDGARRLLVHHFEAAGMMPAPMIAADRGAGLFDVVERRERHLRELRLRQQLDGDLRDDGEQAFAAGDQRQQVVARRIERIAAELDDVAVDQSPRARVRTLCTVRPYFRQCTPPAFSATLPPIEHAICDDGSGA